MGYSDLYLYIAFLEIQAEEQKKAMDKMKKSHSTPVKFKKSSIGKGRR